MPKRFACPQCHQTTATSAQRVPQRCPRCGYAGALAVQADDREAPIEDAIGNRPPAFRPTQDLASLRSGAYGFQTLFGDSVDAERALFLDARERVRRQEDAINRQRAMPPPHFWAAGALSFLVFVAVGFVAQAAEESLGNASPVPGCIALLGLCLAALPIIRIRRRRSARAQQLDAATHEFRDLLNEYGAAGKKYVLAALRALSEMLPPDSGNLTLALLSVEDVRWLLYNRQIIFSLDLLKDSGVCLQRRDWRDVRLESHDESRVATSTATVSSGQKEALWGALIGDSLLGREGATAGAVIGAAGERSMTTETRETTVQRWVVDVYTNSLSLPVFSCDFGRREEQAKQFYGAVARELTLARARDL